MNDFINYLNSTNNVGGNSTGSLAETQVKSSYYDAVKVDRKLGIYITDCVKSGNHKRSFLPVMQVTEKPVFWSKF